MSSTPALVGQVAGNAFSTNLVLTRTTNPGNTLVLCILHQGGSISSVTDTAGNVWVAGPTTFGNTTSGLNQQRASIYYCLSAARITSVTIVQSASSGIVGNLSEWSGIGSYGSGAYAITNPSGSSNSPAQVAAAIGELVIGTLAYYSATTTRDDTIQSPFTAMTNSLISSTVQSSAYWLATSAGSVGPSWAMSPNAAPGSVTARFAPRPGPNLVASYNGLSTASNTGALTSPAFAMQVGDIFIVKCVVEDSSRSFTTPTASGGGITWTSRASSSAGSNVRAQIWTGVVTTAGSFTVSSGAVNSAAWHSTVVEQWRGAQLAATPATVATTGSGAPSATVTTTAANSIVSWAVGDWSAKAPSTRAYRSSAIEDGLHDKSTSIYTAYYAYQFAASSGSQTIGLTAPGSQTWTAVGIELQAIPDTTQVSSTKSVSWSVQSQVSSNKAVAWAVPGQVMKSQTVNWAVKQQVSSTKTVAWAVRKQVSSTKAVAWDVLGGEWSYPGMNIVDFEGFPDDTPLPFIYTNDSIYSLDKNRNGSAVAVSTTVAGEVIDGSSSAKLVTDSSSQAYLYSGSVNSANLATMAARMRLYEAPDVEFLLAFCGRNNGDTGCQMTLDPDGYVNMYAGDGSASTAAPLSFPGVYDFGITINNDRFGGTPSASFYVHDQYDNVILEWEYDLPGLDLNPEEGADRINYMAVGGGNSAVTSGTYTVIVDSVRIYAEKTELVYSPKTVNWKVLNNNYTTLNWPSSGMTEAPEGDGFAQNLYGSRFGLRFQVDQPTIVTGIRFYDPTGDQRMNPVLLTQTDIEVPSGAPLAAGALVPTVPGWNYFAFDTEYTCVPGNAYVAYMEPSYSASGDYWLIAGTPEVDPVGPFSKPTTVGYGQGWLYWQDGDAVAGSTDNAIVMDIVGLVASVTQVSSTKTINWAVRSQVTATKAPAWAVKQQVSSSKAVAWAVKAQVSSTKSVAWAVKSQVTSTKAVSWAVRGSVSSTATVNWAVRKQVSTAQSVAWAVRAPVFAVASVSWAVRGSVSSSKSVAWGVRQQVSATGNAQWAVRQQVSSTKSVAWNVDALTQVSSTASVAWAVRASVASVSNTPTWAVRAQVSSVKSVAWNTRQQVSSSQTVNWNVRTQISSAKAVAWSVRQQITSQASVSWAVRLGVSASQSVAWAVQAQVSSSKTISWAVKAQVSSQGNPTWNVRAQVSSSAAINWAIRNSVQSDATIEWNVYRSVSASASVAWALRAWVYASKEVEWDTHAQVESSATINWSVAQVGQVSSSRSVEWAVRDQVSSDADIAWSVYISAGDATKSVSWGVRAQVSSSKAISWNTTQQVTSQASVSWKVRQQVSASKAVNWKVRGQVASSATVAWAVRQQVTSTKSVTWNVGSITGVSSTKSIAWAVRRQVSATKTPQWAVRQQIHTQAAVAWAVRVTVTQTGTAAWDVHSQVSASKSVNWRVMHDYVSGVFVLWDGTNEIPIVLEGVWNGSVVVPATYELT